MPKSLNRPISRRHLLTQSATIATSALYTSTMFRSAQAAAPFLGQTKPTHYRFKFGDFEITTIVDSLAFVDKVYPIYGQNAGQDKVEQLMKDNLLPINKYQPGFSPTIINTGKEVILFDTGNGDDGFVPRPHGGWLAKQLAPAGFTPEQIDIIVLTHGHLDHIGGIKEKDKEVFPNARYVISEIEHKFWSETDKLPDGLKKFSQIYNNNMGGLEEKTTFIKPGQQVVSGIEAIATYGHTPGHLAFHIESKGKQILFWGDCAHHQVVSLARPGWHCVFDVDKEQAAQTRQKTFDMAATDRLPVVGYHMPFPSIGYVEKINPTSFRWLPHSFQLK